MRWLKQTVPSATPPIRHLLPPFPTLLRLWLWSTCKTRSPFSGCQLKRALNLTWFYSSNGIPKLNSESYYILRRRVHSMATKVNAIFFLVIVMQVPFNGKTVISFAPKISRQNKIPKWSEIVDCTQRSIEDYDGLSSVWVKYFKVLEIYYRNYYRNRSINLFYIK